MATKPQRGAFETLRLTRTKTLARRPPV